MRCVPKLSENRKRLFGKAKAIFGCGMTTKVIIR